MKKENQSQKVEQGFELVTKDGTTKRFWREKPKTMLKKVVIELEQNKQRKKGR